MALQLFIRRTIPATRDEYLFLPVEDEEDSGDYGTTIPSLPGNEAEALTGSASNNFIIDLQNYKNGLQIAGFVFPVPKEDFPTLNSPDRHLMPWIYGNKTQQTPDFDATGKMFKNALWEYWADQGRTTYTDMILGIPEWGADDFNAGAGYTYAGHSPKDVTVAGVKYRLFEGRMKALRTRRAAGFEDQYMYSFSWEVGVD